jgi:phospho-N-acetylmuramoyl-pentapeptide-transferase
VIPWLGSLLQPFFGPFRLLESRLLLMGAGAALGGILTWLLLPRLWHLLPRDGGRAHAVGAEASVGKPVGAGLIFSIAWAVTCLLVIPFDARVYELMGCVLLAMLEGYLDDRSTSGWSELRIGIADLAVSVLGALALTQAAPLAIWLPLTSATFVVPAWMSVPVAACLIWITINATNCTDGVDGLSGSLTTLALFYIGLILYGIVGHPDVAAYLRVPYVPQVVPLAMMSFPMVGCLGGYLWYNAHPSAVLMGDAGSRPVGFLLAVLVLATGNPVLLVVVAGVVFVNGATGLVKVALLRFFRIGIFRGIRWPLHDHVRQALGWSPTQVLLRFGLLQAFVTPVLLLLVLKVR